MDLRLSIEADYKKASEAFKTLANESEETRKKIEKFSESFKTESIDKFINKQKLIQTSFTGTRGEISAMTAVQNNYEKEIERLIKSGLDPESDAIKRLRDEHDKLKDKIEVTTQAHKMQEAAVKSAQMALVGIGAAIVAAGGYALKAAADVEDMTAAFTPLMGSAEKAAELVKKISIEAAATPFEIDKIGDSVKRLLPAFSGSSEEAMKAFRMIGDTAQGNAQKLETITNAYSKAMLKGKASMAELNMIANAGVPIYDELANSMGISVAKMMEMSSSGKITANDLTDAFQKMTGEGGVFFNGMQVSSTTFSSTLLGIKENINIVAGEIGMNLLPAAKEMAGKIYDATRNLIEWINTGDNFSKTIDTITYVLAGVTAGLVAFLVVAKGATIIHGLTTAFKALTTAIAANPIGAIAVVITTVLIPALIYLYKNWDTVQTYLQQGLARLQFAFKWLGSVIEEGLVVAFNTVKAAAVTLIDFIYGNIIRAVGNMLEIMGKLPFVGDLFLAAADKVNFLGNAIGNLAEDTRKSSRDAIQAAHDKQNATEQELKTTLAGIDSEARARREAIEEQKKQNKEAVESEKEKSEEIIEARDEEIKNLVDRLNEIPLSEQQTQNQQIQQFQSFLKQRIDLQINDNEKRLKLSDEKDILALDIETGRQRIAWLQEQNKALQNSQIINGQEKVSLEKAINEMILKEDEALRKNQQKLLEEHIVTLKEKLDKIPFTEQQKQTQQIEQFQSFLQQRMNLELKDNEDRLRFLEDGSKERLNLEIENSNNRIAWLKEQRLALLELETLSGDERIALEKSINDMILIEDTALRENQKKLLEEHIITLKEKLDEIPFNELEIQAQQIEQFQSFLQQRMELQKVNDEEKITWLQENLQTMLELETLNGNERIALEQAVNNMILDEDKKLKDAQVKLNEQKLSSATTLLNGISSLASKGSKHNIGLLILEKAAASAEAAINTGIAVSKALASAPPPYNFVLAAGVGAAGIAQQIAIASTAIPSAETGGRFIVPNSVGVDNTLMRVNPGEEVDVTPRGMTGNNIQRFIFNVEKQTIFDIVNDGLQSGNIYEFSPAWNI